MSVLRNIENGSVGIGPATFIAQLDGLPPSRYGWLPTLLQRYGITIADLDINPTAFRILENNILQNLAEEDGLNDQEGIDNLSDFFRYVFHDLPNGNSRIFERVDLENLALGAPLDEFIEQHQLDRRYEEIPVDQVPAEEIYEPAFTTAASVNPDNIRRIEEWLGLTQDQRERHGAVFSLPPSVFGDHWRASTSQPQQIPLGGSSQIREIIDMDENEMEEFEKFLLNQTCLEDQQIVFDRLLLGVYKEPIIASDGNTYDLSSFNQIARSRRDNIKYSPITREPLKETVTPNLAAKQLILCLLQKYKEKRGSSANKIQNARRRQTAKRIHQKLRTQSDNTRTANAASASGGGRNGRKGKYKRSKRKLKKRRRKTHKH